MIFRELHTRAHSSTLYSRKIEIFITFFLHTKNTFFVLLLLLQHVLNNSYFVYIFHELMDRWDFLWTLMYGILNGQFSVDCRLKMFWLIHFSGSSQDAMTILSGCLMINGICLVECGFTVSKQALKSISSVHLSTSTM